MSARKTTAGTTGRGFDGQAFLDSAGVAKRIVGYRRNEVIFAQGDASLDQGIRINSSLLSVVLHD